jgi:hypothetical protein
MSFGFDPHQGLIITGPSGTALLRLALDTGATSTLINVATLVSLTYVRHWRQIVFKSPREAASNMRRGSRSARS